ncbi:MliC family protein [Luteimonas sp. A611]
MAVDPALADAPPSGTPAAPLPDSTTANFRCGDVLANARFDNARGELTLTIATRRTVLPQVMAASGARYADAQGNEFWNKGDSATLTLGGQTLDCRVTDEVSPWDEARARGVAFRGLGTEPFWSLEVDAGPTPRMRLALDMGERPLVVAQATPLEAGEGFLGSADDGSAVELRITRGSCSDGMSDLDYPASIALTVGAETLKGCGAFLDE